MEVESGNEKKQIRFIIVPMFIIDGVYTARLEKIAEAAPEGVVVKDYKTHLSYYRTQTSKAIFAIG